MKVAALDLGSNTSLLLIADVEDQRITKVHHDETRITKLGQGVHANRKFHPEALMRMRECLTDYAATIKSYGCEKVVAVATSAARDVSNGQDLIQMGKELGLPIHIISGGQEAKLTFKGALCDRATMADTAVIDVGGGSTEIITERDGAPLGTSVDVGSVRLTELFVEAHPISDKDQDRLRAYCTKMFSEAPLPLASYADVVAVAGTPTTLAALQIGRAFDEELVHGFKLTLKQIDEWTLKLAKMTVAEREQLPGMQPKRADVIVAGSIILSSAIRTLQQQEVTVSTRGVRYGVALAWQDF